jgi:hypothetical protein
MVEIMVTSLSGHHAQRDALIGFAKPKTEVIANVLAAIKDRNQRLVRNCLN